MSQVPEAEATGPEARDVVQAARESKSYALPEPGVVRPERAPRTYADPVRVLVFPEAQIVGEAPAKPRWRAAPSLDAVRAGERKFGRGHVGPEVRAAQHKLDVLGFELEQDGYFGPNTQKAVLAFQAEYAVTEEGGRVGPKTLAKLEELYDRRSYAAITAFAKPGGARAEAAAPLRALPEASRAKLTELVRSKVTNPEQRQRLFSVVTSDSFQEASPDAQVRLLEKVGGYDDPAAGLSYAEAMVRGGVQFVDALFEAVAESVESPAKPRAASAEVADADERPPPFFTM